MTQSDASSNKVSVSPDGVATITVDGGSIPLPALSVCRGRRIRVDVTRGVWERVERSHRVVGRIVASRRTVYGINTGFGQLCRQRIADGDLDALQAKLLQSHAVGVGPEAGPDIVRMMMLLKTCALAKGHSGVSRATLGCLVKMIEADVLPLVPIQGSLGASGDLAPLAHMALPIVGLGTVMDNGCPSPAAEALSRHGIQPVALGPKEGLALINGTQFMLAYAVTIVIRATELMKHADIVASMSIDGIKGSVHPFEERLVNLRPHAEAVSVASNIRHLMDGSEIVTSHAGCDRVQDPYSFRCVPYVHGASRAAVRHAIDVFETEMNSVTDNPIVFDDETALSGGLFHGQPLALVLDYLAVALAELGSISERRTYFLLSGHEGLPVQLVRASGLNSGFMVSQYTSAALVSENKGLCMPASVDSIPTSMGQEDHVSMGARAAVKCLQVLDNVETVLAIEQLCAAQALDFRAPDKPGIGARLAHAVIREDIAHLDGDRILASDVRQSLALLRSGRVVEAVEKGIGTLT